MQDFIFSINVTLPIFLVMVVGWGLKQIGMLDDHFVNVANKFNFRVTLPCMLFYDIATVDIREVFDLKFVLFCALVSTVCFWGIWGLTRLLVKDTSIRGAFVQASFRSSAAVMGLAFISNIYGSSPMGPLMVIGAVPLYNVYSVIVLTFEAEGEDGKRDTAKIKQAFINIAKNPIILSILLGVVFAVLGVRLPVVATKTISSLAQLATPLALVVIGAGFEGRKAIKKIKPTAVGTFIKLVGLTAVFLPVAVMMGFRNQELMAILIMLASPSTVTCFVMAKSMNNDYVLSSSIVVLTTFLSSITLTGWIFLLRSFGLI